MKRNLSLSVALLAGLSLTSLGFGTTIFDAALVAPGFYNGTGGANNGFTVTTDNGIEVGLRAMLRQNPADISNGDNSYNVPLGPQTNITSGGNGANASRAAWNVDFSINLQPGNLSAISSGYLLSDITTLLTVTGPGAPASFDVLGITDNAGWGPSGEHDTSVIHALPSDWGAQNSQNALFLGLNMFLPATYTFKLEVFGPGQVLLASSDIVVNASKLAGAAAVPVPAAAWAGLSTLAGMALIGWRNGALRTPDRTL